MHWTCGNPTHGGRPPRTCTFYACSLQMLHTSCDPWLMQVSLVDDSMDDDSRPGPPSQNPKVACKLLARCAYLDSSNCCYFLAVEAIVATMPLGVMRKWEKAWADKGQELLSGNYTSAAESYLPLIDAASNFQSAIIAQCKKFKLTTTSVGWPMISQDSPGREDVLQIYRWLVANDVVDKPQAGQAAPTTSSRQGVDLPLILQ